MSFDSECERLLKNCVRLGITKGVRFNWDEKNQRLIFVPENDETAQYEIRLIPRKNRKSKK